MVDREHTPRGRPNPVLLAIVAEGFLSRLSFGLISFALPLYAYRLGMSLTAIGFLSSLNLVVAVMLKPGSGSLVDKVGLRFGLLAATVLRSIVSLLLAFATLPWQLYATRALHGVSISIRDPAVNALIAENGGKRSIATTFAWYQTAKSAAGALGKVMAGLLLGLTASNFSIVFGVAFALSALPIAIVALYVPNTRSSALEPSLPVPVILPEPVGPRPRMLPFMSLGFLVSGTAYMLANLFPIFAVEYAGLSEAQAGLIYSLSAVVVLAGPVFGWLSDHVSRKLVLSIRSAANVLSSVVYLVAPNLPGMAAGRIVDDLGKAAFRPGWGALMAHVSSFDKRRRARTMGYLSAGEDAGEVTGPILAGFLWSTWGVPALLGARIALAVVTEAYTMNLARSLHRLEIGPTRPMSTSTHAAATRRYAEPTGRRPDAARPREEAAAGHEARPLSLAPTSRGDPAHRIRTRRPKMTAGRDSAWLSGRVDNSARTSDGLPSLVVRGGELTHQPESVRMPWEPISPELVLVDPEFGARARAALPEQVVTPRPSLPVVAAPVETAAPTRAERGRPYPFLAGVGRRKE